MKRLIFTLILSLFITGACLCGNRIINRFCSDTEQALTVCETMLSADEDIFENINQLQKQWEKNQTVLCAFCNRGVLDHLAENFSRLYVSAQNHDLGECKTLCAVIRVYLNELRENQNIYAKSFV